MTAQDLFEPLWKIISGFLKRDVKIASYASDGSTVERALAKLLEERATRVHTVPVTHPHKGEAEYLIKILFFGAQPIAILQDPKHLLKTWRNNLTSGGRFLSFPAGPAMFQQLLDMIESPDSPLYVRDVIKADRQDDNAATRLFSAASLQWITTHHPEWVGLVCYLFVFGDLIDAYQNRAITLFERVLLVLRAHFFLEMWEKFLKVSKYPKGRHFISPQCADIARILIHGFLQALIIYRDYSGPRRPFLPWLLSTEVIEHVFGICRQIVKDFTMLDFQYMVPKLFIALRQATLSSKFSDGRARASGYNHTYTDTRGIDLQALSTYPTDQEINEASTRAFAEAESLFALMGVGEGELYNNTPTRLPPIGAWYSEEDESDDEQHSGDESESDFDDYQGALDDLDDIDIDLPRRTEDEVQKFRCASIALSIQDRVTM